MPGLLRVASHGRRVLRSVNRPPVPQQRTGAPGARFAVLQPAFLRVRDNLPPIARPLTQDYALPKTSFEAARPLLFVPASRAGRKPASTRRRARPCTTTVLCMEGTRPPCLRVFFAGADLVRHFHRLRPDLRFSGKRFPGLQSSACPFRRAAVPAENGSDQGRPARVPGTPHVPDNVRSANAPVPLSLCRRLSQPDKAGRTPGGCPLFFPAVRIRRKDTSPAPVRHARIGVFFQPVSTLTRLRAGKYAPSPLPPCALNRQAASCTALPVRRPGRLRATCHGSRKTKAVSFEPLFLRAVPSGKAR